MDFGDVPDDVLARVRSIAGALPETLEERTGLGWQFRIRRRTLAHVFAVEDPAGREVSMLTCRADPEEREVLLALGHPFFALRSGGDRIGVVLEAATDWAEVAELVTESYRLLAPKKLAASVEVPRGGGGPG